MIKRWIYFRVSVGYHNNFSIVIPKRNMDSYMYRWTWKNEDGSERKVEIRTMHGLEVARQRALAFFPDDTVATDYISNNPPDEL